MKKKDKHLDTFKMLYLRGNSDYPNGMPIKEICKQLPIKKSIAYKWVKDFDLENNVLESRKSVKFHVSNVQMLN